MTSYRETKNAIVLTWGLDESDESSHRRRDRLSTRWSCFARWLLDNHPLFFGTIAPAPSCLGVPSFSPLLRFSSSFSTLFLLPFFLLTRFSRRYLRCYVLDAISNESINGTKKNVLKNATLSKKKPTKRIFCNFLEKFFYLSK